MSAALLEKLLRAPDLPYLAEKVNRHLAEEAKHREAFREWITASVKAEFINGEVVLHSPVKRGHLRAGGNLYTLLSTYVILNDLGQTSFDKGMVALTRNDYEPDLCFWGKEKSAGFTDETMLHPPPDLVVEILSRKTAKTDRTTKFQDYAHHGIPEYWIIDPRAKTVEQYWLSEASPSAYVLVAKWGIGDQITAKTIPGFSIPVGAIFDERERVEVLKGLLG